MERRSRAKKSINREEEDLPTEIVSEKNINKVLPAETVSEILTRLPTESVLGSKLVCKTWKNLIRGPSFSQRHLAGLNHPDSTDSGKLRYVSLDLGDDDEFEFYSFEYKDDEDWNYAKPVHKKFMLKTRYKDLENYVLIGSFNGLICVYGYDYVMSEVRGPAIIFNPVLKEYVVLPGFISSPEHCHRGCGFGYLSKTNEYKVVRLFGNASERNVVEVEVYTVGSGKGWRQVGKFDLGFEFGTPYQQQHGVFLNDCLYWRNNDSGMNTEGGMILVFDLAEEKFLEHIPQLSLHTGMYDENIAMGVSGGGILYYAACQTMEGRVLRGVWLLMKKNDEQAAHQSWSWTEATNLDQREPFAFLEGGTVIRYDQGDFKIFHSSTSTWDGLEDFSKISRQVYSHKHSLVSLKELGEVDVEIMKSRGDGDVEDDECSESWSD